MCVRVQYARVIVVGFGGGFVGMWGDRSVGWVEVMGDCEARVKGERV